MIYEQSWLHKRKTTNNLPIVVGLENGFCKSFISSASAQQQRRTLHTQNVILFHASRFERFILLSCSTTRLCSRELSSTEYIWPYCQQISRNNFSLALGCCNSWRISRRRCRVVSGKRLPYKKAPTREKRRTFDGLFLAYMPGRVQCSMTCDWNI